MRFHWQDLDDGPIKRHWYHGRCWIGSYKRSVDIEWMVPAWHHCRLDFGINGGDGDDKLTFTLALCLFYLHISIPFFRFKVGYWSTYHENFFIHEARQFNLYFHAGGVWLTPWDDPMGGWSRENPWYRDTYHFDPVDFFCGRPKYTKEILKTGETMIPMPEGCYPAKYERQLCTWKRPRSFLKTQRVDYWFDFPGGIPHEGKGENSWDCGEDATFGMGSGKRTLAEAIGDVVGSCLRDREKYGGRHTHRDLQPHIITRIKGEPNGSDHNDQPSR